MGFERPNLSLVVATRMKYEVNSVLLIVGREFASFHALFSLVYVDMV